MRVEAPSWVQSAFHEALAAHRQGRLGQAEILYRQLLAVDPAHFEANLNAGLACAAQQRYEDAITLIGQAVTIRPGSAEAHCCLGDALHLLGRQEQAVSQYQLALDLRLDFPEAHLGLGNALQALQRHTDAVTHYMAALSIRPAYCEARNNLGNALQALGRPQEAVIHYQLALAFQPDFAAAHSNLGNALQALGRCQEAISHYEAALADEPENVQAHNNLGNALRALGRLDDAVAAYESALAINPDSAEVHNNLGTALQALDRLDEAMGHLQQALNIQPSYAQAHYNLANVLQLRKRHGEAISHYQAAIAIRPNYSEAYNNLGSTLLDRHRYAEAMVSFEAALVFKPDNVAARSNLGTALHALGRPEEGLAQHQAALALDPDNRQVHRSLAVLFFRRGEVGTAKWHGERGYGKGIERSPYRGHGPAVSVLVLESALGGNVATGEWLDHRTFLRSTVTTEFVDSEVELPVHDLVINAIGEADLCMAALDAAGVLLARTNAPVVNHPSAVRATARVANARRLGVMPGVVTPRMTTRSRDWFLKPHAADALREDGFRWPLLLRSPGFHTGEHFLKADGPQELASAASRLPGNDLMAIEYVDVRGADRKVRKYRVMTVDGQLYPLHLAIASHWKVHYFSADMAQQLAHRAEEDSFLQNMPQVLGPRVMSGLRSVSDALALDYGGIDFSIDREGRVVVFEANATMVVPTPPSDEMWSYRRIPVANIHDAVRTMLLTRARTPAQPIMAGGASCGQAVPIA